MLGLADKSALRTLFGALLAGDPPAMLAEVERQYAYGVEPLALIRSLMELTHRIAVTQVGEAGADAPSQEERQAIEEWAGRLSVGQVHRLWQLLLKGHEEVRGAPDPLVSAQMALLRVLHAVDLPDPGTLAKQLGELAASGDDGRVCRSAAQPAPAPVAAIDWRELCERVDRAGMLRVGQHDARLDPGDRARAGPAGLRTGPGHGRRSRRRAARRAAQGDRRALAARARNGGGRADVARAGRRGQAADAERVRRDPLVEAAFAAFPAAEFVEDDESPKGDRNWSKRA